MSPPTPKRNKKTNKSKSRSRPTPKWLSQDKLDEVAKRRTLMLLDVLSGRTAVTDAIKKAKISRGTYYQLETKALRAMLTAMRPGADGATSDGAIAKKVDKLNCKIDALEQDKRRLERLLSLATKVLKPGPITQRRTTRTRRSQRQDPSASSGSSNKNSKPGTRTQAGESE